MAMTKRLLLLCTVVLLAATASATTILTFGQTGSTNTITGTTNGTTSTITGTNVAITVTQIDAGIATPFSAFLNLSATSTAPATTLSGNVTQNFSGTFSITSGAGGTGTNFLSGSFSDTVFGAASGASLTLSVSQPPDSVSFNSNVIAAGELGLTRAISLSFANVTPGVNISNGSPGSFSSSVSGTFSANVGRVPEPATLALLGSGLLLFVSRRHRR